jgi:hypothetical protein
MAANPLAGFQGTPPYFTEPQGRPPAVRSAALPPIVAPRPGPYTRYKAGIAPAASPSAWAVRNGSGTTSLG